MNKKKNILIVASLFSTIVLSGCASNDEIIAQQKQHAEQINNLGSKVNTLKNELQQQQNISDKTAITVSKISVEYGELKSMTAKHYLIKEDDTLSSIAVKHGILLKQLRQLNPQIDNPNLLLIGHIINIK